MPIIEPVTLADIKTFMRIDADYVLEDTLLLELISVAREYVEEYTGRNLIEREMTFQSDEPNFYLPGAPIKSIISVTDELGEPVVYKLRDNTVITDTRKLSGVSIDYFGGYRPHFNPFDRIDPIFTVLYTGGYAVSAVPAPLKQAIRKLVFTMYENKDSFSTGGSTLKRVIELPFGIKDLMHPYSLRAGLFFV